MPLGGTAKCPRCSKPVYFSEEVSAKGRKWHKSCLSCGICSKGLDSFSLNEHESNVFCKECFVKYMGATRNGGSAGGADVEANGTGHGDEENEAGKTPYGCPRCFKAVYFAEEKLAFGKKWHKMCFKCGECNKLLDTGSAAERGGDAFCKGCYGKLFGPKGYGFAGGSAGLSANSDGRYDESDQGRRSFSEAQAAPRRQSTVGSGPLCPHCGTTVYFAEEVIAIGSKWHKLCLKCDVCKKLLDSGSVQEHMGVPHCKACYGKKHGPKGYGFGGVGAGLSANREDDGPADRRSSHSYAEAQAAPLLRRQSTVGNGPLCPRCSTTVYFAEEVIAVGSKWHKLCLKCDVCNKLLDGGSVQEHMGVPHCKNCYGKKHGPKGYGFGGVGAGLSANREDDGSADGRLRHSFSEAQAAPLLRRQSTVGNGPVCPRCCTTVYFAEEIAAIGSKWHKLCLKCDICSKLLDGGSVQEHMGAPHCKTCYGKKHGPKGYGFGGVGAGLSVNREDGAEPSDRRSSFAEAQVAPLLHRQSSISGGPLCPRCKNAVYFAEEVVAAGSKWHKICLKCDACNKMLDGGSVQEHNGLLYCKACYGRKYGPKGYGFAGGSAGLSANRDDNEEIVSTIRDYSYSDETADDQLPMQPSPTYLTESAEADDECHRCSDRVDSEEALIVAGLKWHPMCLTCNACSKTLAIGGSSRSVAEYGGEVYCTACYSRHFGTKGYDLAAGDTATANAGAATAEWL